MGKLEKTLTLLSSVEINRDEKNAKIDPRGILLITLIYLCIMLSVPVDNLEKLLLFALYPVVAAPLFGFTFSKILLKSLWIIPFVGVIGVFNPIYNNSEAFKIGNVIVTRGWLEFICIILRGLLSFQALLILILSCGFPGMVRSMRRLGCPAFLTVQMMMVFRYLTVILSEALTMQRARSARSYGNNKMKLKMWSVLIGQLFLRTYDRAERIHRAMLARGFNGSLPVYSQYEKKWSGRDSCYLIFWILFFILLRCINVSDLFMRI